MPIDVARVKGKLKELFPKVNLSTKRLDEISARLANKPADDADDAAIVAIINDANDFMPFADIAKEDDRIRTLEANQKKPATEEKTGGDGGNPNPEVPKPDDDMPAWAKKMSEFNEKLLNEVTELKKGNVIQNKRAEAKKLFELNETLKGLDKDVQEHYLNHLKLDDDTTPLEDQVTGLAGIVQKIVQTKVDSTELPGKPPVGADVKAFTDKDMDMIINNVKA